MVGGHNANTNDIDGAVNEMICLSQDPKLPMYHLCDSKSGALLPVKLTDSVALLRNNRLLLCGGIRHDPEKGDKPF